MDFGYTSSRMYSLLTKAGTIEPSSHTTITAMFQSMAGRGEEWQEAVLIVQKQNDDGTWSELTKLKLQGAAGEPKIDLNPNEVDFGVVGVSQNVRAGFQVRNDVIFTLISGKCNSKL